MGTWDVDSFGNDTACDWAYDLEETEDLSLVGDTLQRVINSGDGYLEAGDAEEGVAAAEVVARLKGNFGARNAYTETVDAWVAENPVTPPRNLVDSAMRALERISSPPSELREQWEESEDFEKWRKSLADLMRRVRE